MKGKHTDFEDTIREYTNWLELYDLKEAFEILRERLAPLPDDGQLREEALTLCDSYDLMLESMARNAIDPDRYRIFEQMAKWGFEMAVKLRLEHDDFYSHSHYHNLRREHQKQPLPPYVDFQDELEAVFTQQKMLHGHSDEVRQERERLEEQENKRLDVLFEKIWTSGLWTEEEAHQMHQLMQSPALSMLVGLCCHPKMQVSQRALVGICLTVCCHYEIMATLESVWSVLDMLAEVPDIQKRLQTIQMEFIHACLAERIAQQIQGNIIPVVTHEAQQLEEEMKRAREADDELDEDVYEEVRAQGDERISKITDSVRTIHELQSEGEDIYLSSFRNLKTDSFFLDPAHWFYLFSADSLYVQPILQKFSGKQGETMRYLMQSVVFCNSDKYSFCFSLMGMNGSQISMFTQQLEEQREAVMDNVTFRNSVRRRAEGMEEITRQYVQDLNRYFKCWRFQHEEIDPFDSEDDTDFIRCAPISKLAPDHSFHLQVIPFLRKWKLNFWSSFYYEDLEEAGEHLTECHKWHIEDLVSNNNLYVAIPLLQQMIQRGEEPKWAIRMLMKCARKEHSYLNELDVYHQWMELEPENEKVAIQYAKRLVYRERFEESLPWLHRWEYVAKNPVEAYRSLVWVLINLKRADDALNYSQRVFAQSQPVYDDWINAGHIAFMQGDNQRALDLYRKAIPLYTESKREDICYSVGEIENILQPMPHERRIDIALIKDIIYKEITK
jgi:tetratricopeptide (TPR) repeat protein